MLFGDYSRAVERVIEPEVRSQRMVCRGCNDAIFKNVAGLEAENADGLDAGIMIGGSVDDGGIGIIGDGAGKNVGDATTCVSDANHGDFDCLEAAVEIEIQAAELADAELVVDPDAGVDFFSRVSVSFETVFGFE